MTETAATSQKRYWHEIEGLDWKSVVAIQERKLAEQVRYLYERSPFYRDKFLEACISPDDIKTIRDLQKVPFTVKDEIRRSLKAAPPLGLHLAAKPEDVIQIQASSGTTGSPSYVGATRHDLQVWWEMGARVFYANGFRPGDVCLHAYSMSKGFVGGVVNFQILQYMGVCDIPIGAEAGAEKLLRVIADQRPMAMAGTPNFIMYLGERAKDVLGVEARDLSIRKISVGGEPGGGIPSVRGRIEEIWGADVRDMMGGADFGSTYWAECDEKDGMHFCGQEFLIPEIIDPRTGESLEITEGTEGELVYNAIDREASPLLRYRSGDLVQVVGTSCRCGRTGFRIKCFGRSDDMLIVRGINVFPSGVKDVITSFRPQTTGMMKVVVDFPGHATQDRLKIKVEHGHGVAAEALLALKAELEERLKNLLSFNAEVIWVPPDTLEKPGAQKVQLIERVT